MRRWTLMKEGAKMWSGFIHLRTGSSDGLSWTRR